MMQLKRRSKANFKPFPIHVKTGDTVFVVSGKNKGQTGIVRRIFNEKGRVLVDGINKIKKATRPNPMAGVRGGIVEMEAPIAAAKVMLYCLQCNKPTRIHYETLPNGRKTRVCKHCQAQFDS